MNARAFRWFAGLLIFVLSCGSTLAVPPKDGRYKGTLTIRAVVDGTTTEIKKVIPITGVLEAGTLQAIMLEIPVAGDYFNGRAFHITVGDGSISMLPNNNAMTIPLMDVKTAASSLKGSVDLGLALKVNGNFSPLRRFLSLSMTRVGNLPP